jgi:transketolase
MEPVVAKWKAFRWHTIEINGHDVKQILRAVEKAKKVKGQPVMSFKDACKSLGAWGNHG